MKHLHRWLGRAAATGMTHVRVEYQDEPLDWIPLVTEGLTAEEGVARALAEAEETAEQHAAELGQRLTFDLVACIEDKDEDHSRRTITRGQALAGASALDRHVFAHVERCHKLLLQSGEEQRRQLLEQNARLQEGFTEVLRQQVRLARTAQQLEDTRHIRDLVTRELDGDEKRKEQALELLSGVVAPALHKLLAAEAPELRAAVSDDVQDADVAALVALVPPDVLDGMAEDDPRRAVMERALKRVDRYHQSVKGANGA